MLNIQKIKTLKYEISKVKKKIIKDPNPKYIIQKNNLKFFNNNSFTFQRNII